MLLSDSLRNALGPAAQAAYELAISKTRGIKQHHEKFLDEYEKIKPRLKAAKGTDWLTTMDNALELVFSYYRNERNSAGHPSGYALSKEHAASHLMIFPHYLRSIYDLIEWCDANMPI